MAAFISVGLCQLYCFYNFPAMAAFTGVGVWHAMILMSSRTCFCLWPPACVIIDNLECACPTLGGAASFCDPLLVES